MEITEEFATQHQLSPEQIAAVKTFGADYIANEKKSWDDKLKADGNEFANGIIEGVVAPIEKETGVKRDKGEKAADFLKRAAGGHLAAKLAEVEALKVEYQEKIKNGGTDEALKGELAKAKEEIDRLKKVEAEYEPIKGVAAQYKELEDKYGSLKLETAFTKVRPAFPDTVNPYEADAKWNKFKDEVLTKHDIEIVDGEPIAIDKENNHKRYKLAELAAANKDLSALSAGRQQGGSGTNPKEMTAIEGVPFKLPADASSEERNKAIRDYLTVEKKMSITDSEYATEYSKINTKILEAAKK